ncbi:MAG: CerR family C-terminal domain-containing protein [Vulcanimicrobiaceae bacterium]
MASHVRSRPRSVEKRLLDTAVEQFSRGGIESTSTRSIAAAAGTTMSSITYHYGSKEGLYAAAARHMAGQIGEHVSNSLRASERARDRTGGAEAPSAAILALVDRFVQIMVRPESATWARFIAREQMDPTEAFDILYKAVMGRLLDRLSSLLVEAGGGRCSAAEARLRSLAIFGQALVFRLARATVLRANQWDDIGVEEASAIRQAVRAQTAAILASIASDAAPRARRAHA